MVRSLVFTDNSFFFFLFSDKLKIVKHKLKKCFSFIFLKRIFKEAKNRGTTKKEKNKKNN